MRKLLTPAVTACPDTAASAMPSAAGIVPPTFVVTPPVALPEQMSKAPEQSAKLMTIDGVPLVKALGAGNRPCVNCSKLTPPATNEADSAAYSALPSVPVANATMSPHSVEVPE